MIVANQSSSLIALSDVNWIGSRPRVTSVQRTDVCGEQNAPLRRRLHTHNNRRYLVDERILEQIHKWRQDVGRDKWEQSPERVVADRQRRPVLYLAHIHPTLSAGCGGGLRSLSATEGRGRTHKAMTGARAKAMILRNRFTPMATSKLKKRNWAKASSSTTKCPLRTTTHA